MGELSVDCFFLISGYLITQSVIQSKTPAEYVARRFWRIYPAFILAFLLCVYVMAPHVGALGRISPARTAWLIATLQGPIAPGALAGLHYPSLDGAMWTIPYEFRCYVLILLLGMSGMLKRPLTMLFITGAGLMGFAWSNFRGLDNVESRLDRFHVFQTLGISIDDSIRLTSIFFVGACFYLFRDAITKKMNRQTAAMAAAILIPLLCVRAVAEVAFVTLGAWTLFWLAFKANFGAFQRINDRWDISYGVYLYGWPIQTLIIWYDRSISPWVLAPLALGGAAVCGAASWWGLERWTKGLGRRRWTLSSVRLVG